MLRLPQSSGEAWTLTDRPLSLRFEAPKPAVPWEEWQAWDLGESMNQGTKYIRVR